MNLFGPFSLANGRVRRELFVRDQSVEQFVGLSQSMCQIAAPGVILGARDDPRSQRVGLDVSQDRQQVLVILDHGLLNRPCQTCPLKQ